MLTNIRSIEANTNRAVSADKTFEMALFSRQPVAATGLIAVLGNSFRVAGLFDDPATLPQAMAQLTPDILVLEVSPDVTLEVVRQVRQMAPRTRIVLWVDKAPTEFISQSLTLGVTSILKKNASAEKHIECLTETARGKVSVDRDVTAALLTGRKVRLTPRERQLIALLSQGLANKEVAWRLGLTPGTVKVYLSRLFDKLGVSDRFELALMALRNTGGEWNAPAGPTTENGLSGWTPSEFVHLPMSAAA